MLTTSRVLLRLALVLRIMLSYPQTYRPRSRMAFDVGLVALVLPVSYTQAYSQAYTQAYIQASP